MSVKFLILAIIGGLVVGYFLVQGILGISPGSRALLFFGLTGLGFFALLLWLIKRDWSAYNG